MKITILSLFPEMFDGFLTHSIIKRAIANNLVEIHLVNIRDFTQDKYHRVDTPPIGGGAGLVMKAQPIVDALQAQASKAAHKVLLSPRGNAFNQIKARQFAQLEELVLICGHYEGIDERVNHYVDELISGGDFILTGGELIAAVISDAVIRLLDGAITAESTVEESFDDGLLEYPQYTEPFDFQGHKVPDILYSGNHSAIAKWRQLQRLILTRTYRPDLFKNYVLSKKDQHLIAEHDENIIPKWLIEAVNKGHKFMKEKKNDGIS